MIGPFAGILFTGLLLFRQQLDGEPVVGVASLVRVPLAAFRRRHDDILIAVAIHIGDRQSHRRLQPICRFLSAHFQRPIEQSPVEGDARFASDREVSHAVVVEIECHGLGQRRVCHTSGPLQRDHARRRDFCENDVQSVWSRSDHVPRTVAVEFLDEQRIGLLERCKALSQLTPAEPAVPQTFEYADAVRSRDEDVQVGVLVPITNHCRRGTELGGWEF